MGALEADRLAARLRETLAAVGERGGDAERLRHLTRATAEAGEALRTRLAASGAGLEREGALTDLRRLCASAEAAVRTETARVEAELAKTRGALRSLAARRTPARGGGSCDVAG